MDNLLSLGLTNGNHYTLTLILLNLVLSLLLALMISFVYQKTHRGLSYSQTLAFTLIFLTVVISVAMMVIGNSLARAFGLLGAFSIIRFRTAIKNTKDIAYVFFALVIGMAVGTGSYLIAVVADISICIILLILSKINFGSMKKFEYIVTFVLDNEKTPTEAYKLIFDKYLQNSSLLNVKSKAAGKKLEFTFYISFMDESKTGEFSEELGGVAGISEVNVLVSKNDLEY